MQAVLAFVVSGIMILAFAGVGGADVDGGDLVHWEGVSAVVMHVHEAELDGDWLFVPVTIADLFVGPAVSGLAVASFDAVIHLPTGGLTFAGPGTCMDCTVIVYGNTYEGTFTLDIAGEGTLEAGGTFTWDVIAGEGDLAGLMGAGSGTFTPLAPLVDHLEFTGWMHI